jgi:hypothetical protein
METVSQSYSNEQLIAEALNKLSPSQIKKSKVVCHVLISSPTNFELVTQSLLRRLL